MGRLWSPGPTWAHLPPTSPQLGLDVPEFGPKLDPFGGHVEVHMASRWGHGQPNPKSSKRPFFTSIFHILWLSMTLRLKQCSPCCVSAGPNLVWSCPCASHGFNLRSIWIALGPKLKITFSPRFPTFFCFDGGVEGHVAHIGLALGPTSAPRDVLSPNCVQTCPSCATLDPTWAQVSSCGPRTTKFDRSRLLVGASRPASLSYSLGAGGSGREAARKLDSITFIPVVPHKAAAEVSKIGNL